MSRSTTRKQVALLILLLVVFALAGLVFFALLQEQHAPDLPERSKAARNSSPPAEKNVGRTKSITASSGSDEKSNAKIPPPTVSNLKDSSGEKIKVEGSVVSREGAGVSGATVYLFSLGAGAAPAYQGQSDEKGRFVIRDVPPGDFKLFAQKGNFRSQQVFDSSLGDDVQGVTIVLPSTGEIIGTIRDKAGEPIPEVTIVLFPVEGSDPQTGSARRLKSQSDGSFRIVNVDGNTPVKLDFSKRGYLDYEERVDFTSGLETYSLEIIMEESGRIYGRVIDEHGAPVHNAKIYLRGTEKLRLQLAQTDHEGFFEAGYLREPLYDLTVLATDFAPRKLTAIPINHSELSIVLTNGSSLLGRIQFGQEDGSHPFTIEAIPSNPSGTERYDHYRLRSFHNPENEFTLDHLPPGEYTLKVESRSWALTYKGPFFVAENEVVEEILIPVERGVALTGRAYKVRKGDAAEEVFPSVLVHLVKAAGPYVPFISAVSDNNGRFAFRRIPQGNYLIVAGRGDFRYKSERFALEPDTEYDEFPITLKENPLIDLPASINPPIVGIGVILRRFEDAVRIEKVLSGGPAALGGLQEGDLIVAVDNYPVDGLSLSEIIDRVRGAMDTAVVLGVERDGYFLEEEVIRNRIGY